ncbi:hypothetical protein [Photobacterium proteolyticum]|uniref:hypothetical protein n=1 Tax=Photobacterium proteolyticum TaxID=1903952 RepID=UPI000A827947|nr:hypothetical protein [Photobacterium proteolyticum]
MSSRTFDDFVSTGHDKKILPEGWWGFARSFPGNNILPAWLGEAAVSVVHIGDLIGIE